MAGCEGTCSLACIRALAAVLGAEIWLCRSAERPLVFSHRTSGRGWGEAACTFPRPSSSPEAAIRDVLADLRVRYSPHGISLQEKPWSSHLDSASIRKQPKLKVKMQSVIPLKDQSVNQGNSTINTVQYLGLKLYQFVTCIGSHKHRKSFSFHNC